MMGREGTEMTMIHERYQTAADDIVAIVTRLTDEMNARGEALPVYKDGRKATAVETLRRIVEAEILALLSEAIMGLRAQAELEEMLMTLTESEAELMAGMGVALARGFISDEDERAMKLSFASWETEGD